MCIINVGKARLQLSNTAYISFIPVPRHKLVMDILIDVIGMYQRFTIFLFLVKSHREKNRKTWIACLVVRSLDLCVFWTC